MMETMMTHAQFSKPGAGGQQDDAKPLQPPLGPKTAGERAVVVGDNIHRNALLTNDADLQRFFAKLIEELLRDEKRDR
jgi:hypothetical protein